MSLMVAYGRSTGGKYNRLGEIPFQPNTERAPINGQLRLADNILCTGRFLNKFS